ncbi:AAA family ATPase [Myxococcota bacterium]|nr:AAA family ATPase [Myxococcota bacterium]
MKDVNRVHVSGYRSLKDVTVQLGPLTCLIGPNGAGKSNFLSFLRLLGHLPSGGLRLFVGRAGGASALLSRGRGALATITWLVEAEDEQGVVSYSARLGRAGEQLVFEAEQVFGATPLDGPKETAPFGVGLHESALPQVAEHSTLSKLALWSIQRINSYHFHDTGPNAPLRSNARVADDRYLRTDGSNLAAILFARRHSQRTDQQAAWVMLSGLVQRIAPYIHNLEPTLNDDGATVRLDWEDEDHERYGVDALSDGTLRAIALFTALTQPAATLPKLITIDEPELGLHPAALSLLIELIRSRAADCRVLLATQSPALLDLLHPDEVVVVEREEGGSTFKRLDADALQDWLDDYRLSDLFDRGVLGGRP